MIRVLGASEVKRVAIFHPHWELIATALTPCNTQYVILAVGQSRRSMRRSNNQSKVTGCFDEAKRRAETFYSGIWFRTLARLVPISPRGNPRGIRIFPRSGLLSAPQRGKNPMLQFASPAKISSETLVLSCRYSIPYPIRRCWSAIQRPAHPRIQSYGEQENCHYRSRTDRIGCGIPSP
jgi:hypothetical protein